MNVKSATSHILKGEAKWNLKCFSDNFSKSDQCADFNYHNNK